MAEFADEGKTFSETYNTTKDFKMTQGQHLMAILR